MMQDGLQGLPPRPKAKTGRLRAGPRPASGWWLTQFPLFPVTRGQFLFAEKRIRTTDLKLGNPAEPASAAAKLTARCQPI